jgi:hypothetical protein
MYAVDTDKCWCEIQEQQEFPVGNTGNSGPFRALLVYNLCTGQREKCCTSVTRYKIVFHFLKNVSGLRTSDIIFTPEGFIYLRCWECDKETPRNRVIKLLSSFLHLQRKYFLFDIPCK